MAAAHVAAACATERLAQRARDDVDPVRDLVQLRRASPVGPMNPTACESSTMTMAPWRSASSQISARGAT